MPKKRVYKTGGASRALSFSDRRRLREFRARAADRLGRSSLGIPELKLVMEAPFKWDTLKRALDGKTLRADNCRFIEDFLDRFDGRAALAPAAGLDGKSLAAGERENHNDENGVLQNFVRRGRDTQDAVDEAIRRGSR